MRDVLVALSQSGTTADTLKVIDAALQSHALAYGITNRVGSTLAKRVRAGTYLHAGPEIAVASTKAFTAQVAALILVTAYISPKTTQDLVKNLRHVPDALQQALKCDGVMQDIAAIYQDQKQWFFLGRGYTLPLAREGALKLEEIAYVSVYSDSAAELKHGPLALVESGTPVVAIIPSGESGYKMLSNLSEAHARGGHIIALTAQGGPATPMAKHRIELPSVMDELKPIAWAPAVQILAYHSARLRGLNPDRPRNLAKSVTVE
jgi:glucosamine--fructose-6-phosphate aminotransferase (isomerizing)